MAEIDDRTYLAARARVAREQAAKTIRADVRRVHLELAERYEARAAAPIVGRTRDKD